VSDSVLPATPRGTRQRPTHLRRPAVQPLLLLKISCGPIASTTDRPTGITRRPSPKPADDALYHVCRQLTVSAGRHRFSTGLYLSFRLHRLHYACRRLIISVSKAVQTSNTTRALRRGVQTSAKAGQWPIIIIIRFVVRRLHNKPHTVCDAHTAR